MAYRELDEVERRELHNEYIKIQESLYSIEHMIRGTRGEAAAKAYWFAGLSTGLNEEKYHVGGNPTMQSYLRDHDIIDSDDRFIEPDDEDEDEEEEEEEEDG